ncbi:RDD family protein [Taibaiella lutea]|uniref:RDD family protein n=1 Tax=Taibaiella lutea TaxID=2608001 RepID=A0A5M6CN01_9BACT|nr:RDD family protein [Taibaiella lutea]KAA5536423.1 RDD family protein [Taibaiella lutea]
MALITINTPFNIDLEFSLAAFYKRMFAWLIDLLVVFIYCYIMLFFVYQNVIDENRWNAITKDNLSLLLLIGTVLVPVMLYHLLFEIFMNGRSPGKFFMGIKVINMEGASATISQLLLRWILCLANYFLIVVIFITSPIYLFTIAFFMGVVSLPDIICIAVTKHSQRFGDLAAGTVVVDTRYKMDIHETIFMDLQGQTYQPVYPEVLKLTDRDINGIRNLLAGKLNTDTENYMMRVAYRIEEVLNIKMNGEPVFFLQTLLKDYNYLTQNK